LSLDRRFLAEIPSTSSRHLFPFFVRTYFHAGSTDDTNGTETPYPCGAHEFTP